MDKTAVILFSSKSKVNYFDILHDEVHTADGLNNQQVEYESCSTEGGLKRCRILCRGGTQYAKNLCNLNPEGKILIDTSKSVIINPNLAEYGFVRPYQFCWPIYKPGNVIKGVICISLCNDSDHILDAQMDIQISLIRQTSVVNFSRQDEHESENISLLISYKLWPYHKTLWDVLRERGILLEDVGEVDKILLPFQIPLPSNIEASLQPMGTTGEAVSEVYSVVSSIMMRGPTVTRYAFDSRGIWIETSGRPVYDEGPQVVMRSFPTGVFGHSGNIDCLVSLPKQVYRREEEIPLHLEIHNCSRYPVDSLHVSLQLLGKIDCKGGSSSTMNDLELKYQTQKVGLDGPVPGERKTHNMSVALNFDSTDLSLRVLPQSTTRTLGGHLQFQYSLVVCLVRSWPRKNFSITLPVIICDDTSLY